MKRVLFLIVCIITFLYSWYRFQESKEVESSITTTQTQPSTYSAQSKSKPLKKSNETASKQRVRILPIKKKTIKAKKPERSSSPRNFNEKKMAIGDEAGNIYPTELSVKGSFVVAFGDLIVGSAKDVEAIRNGEKVVSVPYPKLWPKGIVPIEVSVEIQKSEQFKWIKEIMTDLKEKAQIEIRLANKSDDAARVLISRGDEHCFAQVGFTGASTHMSLSKNCSKLAIYHEFFHILGFFHEQNRFDREQYLEILWENIDEDYWPQFKLFPENSFQRKFSSGPPFEFSFETIMLYGSSFFSSNGDYSMVRDDGTPFHPNFQAPTQVDILRLKELYQSEIK